MSLPPSVVLLEILAALSDGETDVFVVELGTIKLQEVDQVLSEVHVVGATFLVLPLKVTGDHHGEQK